MKRNSLFGIFCGLVLLGLVQLANAVSIPVSRFCFLNSGKYTMDSEYVASNFPGVKSGDFVEISELLSKCVDKNGLRRIDTSRIGVWCAKTFPEAFSEFESIAATNGNVTCYYSVAPNAFSNLICRLSPLKRKVASRVGNWEFPWKGFSAFRHDPVSLCELFPESKYACDEWREALRESYIRAVKIWFREQDRTFVSEEGGENPLSPYIERFFGVMDSPRLVGLEELFAVIGVEVSLDRSFIPSEEELDDLKWKILIDDEKLETHKNKMRLVLGTQKLNEFILRYNKGGLEERN